MRSAQAPWIRTAITAAAVLVWAGCAHPSLPVIRVLMITRGEFRDGQSQARRLAERLTARGELAVEITSDRAGLTEAQLTPSHLLMFTDCAQEELSDASRRAILDYVRSGKGIVAVHGAIASFPSWLEWAELLGGSASELANAGDYSVTVLDPHHAAMLGLGGRFTFADRPYLIDHREPTTNLLIRTTTPFTGPQGNQSSKPDPLVWTNRWGDGRVFVVNLGHDERSQLDHRYISLLHNGMRWASGRLPDTEHNVLTKSEREVGFELLFDGRDLDGWSGDMRTWSAENGELVGRARDLSRNIFLTYRRPYGDFLLRFSAKIICGNSGVQFRSKQFPGYVVKGYQADAASGEWGNLYDEGNGRHVLANGFKGKAKEVVRDGGWNDMTVKAVGRNITITLNGLTTVQYTEPESNHHPEGVIALQLHRGPCMQVHFRDIRIRPLTD